jgi:hypothetical protein
METAFIPGRIDRCAECDSQEIVFPKRGDRKRKKGRPTGSDRLFTTIFGFPFFFLLESCQIIIHDSVL